MSYFLAHSAGHNRTSEFHFDQQFGDNFRQRGFESQHNEKVLFCVPLMLIWVWYTYQRCVLSSRFLKKKSHWLILSFFNDQKLRCVCQPTTQDLTFNRETP